MKQLLFAFLITISLSATSQTDSLILRSFPWVTETVTHEFILDGVRVHYDACYEGSLDSAKDYYAGVFNYMGSGYDYYIDGVKNTSTQLTHFFERKLMTTSLLGYGIRIIDTTFSFLVDTASLAFSYRMWRDSMCPIDTIYGLVYFQSKYSTHSEVTEGYFIAACGGYQIGGNYYDGHEFTTPTWIPAYFIRNDAIIKGKRAVNNYVKQRTSGYFTDAKFHRIPTSAVYGLLKQ